MQKSRLRFYLWRCLNMKHRDFIAPTEKEISERRNMYAKAEELGIDLLNFDSKDKKDIRKDIRKAVVFLGTGREVPAELKEKLRKRKVNPS